MNACTPFFFVLFWHRLIGGGFKSSFTTFNHLNPIKVHNQQTAIKTEAVKSTAFTRVTKPSRKAALLKWRAETQYHISHYRRDMMWFSCDVIWDLKSHYRRKSMSYNARNNIYLPRARTGKYRDVSRLTRKLNSVALRCYQWKHIGDPWPDRLPSKPGSENAMITGQRGLFLTTSCADRNSDLALEQARLWSTVHSHWKTVMNRWDKPSHPPFHNSPGC